ncbi:hypothetical protein ACSBR1_019223 [Camellia fascicularis]
MEDFIIDSLKKNLCCRFSSLLSSLSPGIENPRSVNLKPKVPTKAVCAEHLELRKEILTLLNLQKQIFIVVALGFQSLSVLFVSNGDFCYFEDINWLIHSLSRYALDDIVPDLMCISVCGKMGKMYLWHLVDTLSMECPRLEKSSWQGF